MYTANNTLIDESLGIVDEVPDLQPSEHLLSTLYLNPGIYAPGASKKLKKQMTMIMMLCTANGGVSKQDMEELVKEVEMMTSLGRHDNVIQLIGCACSADGIVGQIIFFCSYWEKILPNVKIWRKIRKQILIFFI